MNVRYRNIDGALGGVALVLLLLCAVLASSCSHLFSTPRDAELRKLLADDRPAARVDFEGDVRPILEARCLPCHGGPSPVAGVSLDTREALFASGFRGSFVVPDEPLRSGLFRVIILSDSEPGAMPPTGHALEVGEIKLLRNWIRQGAEWGEEDSAPLQPVKGAEPRSI